MSLYFNEKGITKLSELEIDADKNWKGKGISNLLQLRATSGWGDILSHDSSIIVNILPDSGSWKFLQTRGPGKLPWWRTY